MKIRPDYPDYYEAYYNWGIALDAWARTKSGVEANELFKQAKDILLKAESIKLGVHLIILPVFVLKWF